jgi:hypothetical protein
MTTNLKINEKKKRNFKFNGSVLPDDSSRVNSGNVVYKYINIHLWPEVLE